LIVVNNITGRTLLTSILQKTNIPDNNTS